MLTGSDGTCSPTVSGGPHNIWKFTLNMNGVKINKKNSISSFVLQMKKNLHYSQYATHREQRSYLCINLLCVPPPKISPIVFIFNCCKGTIGTLVSELKFIGFAPCGVPLVLINTSGHLIQCLIAISCNPHYSHSRIILLWM